jgi:hypothetical protein
MSVKQVFNTSAELDYPTVLPTLDLDFANSKTLDPRITFTRASGGSYTGADGLIKYAGVNEARFDHNPTTGESLGLLVEESRTNLSLRSEEFNDAYWLKLRSSIVANIIVAPDGTMTGDKLVEDTATNSHFAARTETTTNTIPITWSVFVKAGERSFLNFVVRESTTFARSAFVIFNLVLGTVGTITTTGGASSASATITPVGNDWYRCSLTCILGGTDTNSQVLWQLYTTTNVYVGDGTSGIYIWGAQFEQGSFPTSYIPTEGSTRTRAADSASITGKNFSEWYRQDEGTVYQEFIQNTNLTSGVTYLNSAGNINEAIRLFYNESVSNYFYSVRTGGVEQSSITNLGGPNAGFRERIAFTYKNNDLSACRNGGALSTDSTASIPNTINRIEFGTTQVPTYLNGTLQRWCYYPKRLPNQQLQALTS